MKKVITLNYEQDGTPVTVQLRMELGSLIKLENKYNQKGLALIMGGLDSTKQMLDILDEALNFKGNENEVKTGAELYDLIVENDKGGISGFTDIITSIAVTCGKLNEEEKARTINGISSIFNSDPNMNGLPEIG